MGEIPSSYYIQDLGDLGITMLCLALGISSVLYVIHLASERKNNEDKKPRATQKSNKNR